ncbi:MAG: hypothetical protein D6788_06230, partial [Planctomycetota bacterium]
LVSDLDGTLLGDDAALATFAAWYERQRSWLGLVYASGRFFDSVCDSIRQTDLPDPLAVIGGVGTEVRRYPSGEEMEEARVPISPAWSAARIERVLADVPGLEKQPDEFQSPFKVSFFLYDASPAELRAVRRRLDELPASVDMIYSSQRDLDVVPAGVNKGGAARRLAQAWKIPPTAVMTAGDSGNDRSLLDGRFRGIVVANAHEELKALRGPGIYQAKQPFAAGVLEGIRYWTEEKAETHERL